MGGMAVSVVGTERKCWGGVFPARDRVSRWWDGWESTPVPVLRVRLRVCACACAHACVCACMRACACAWAYAGQDQEGAGEGTVREAGPLVPLRHSWLTVLRGQHLEAGDGIKPSVFLPVLPDGGGGVSFLSPWNFTGLAEGPRLLSAQRLSVAPTPTTWALPPSPSSQQPPPPAHHFQSPAQLLQ